MYDGKQVVRVETKYKSADLYNIGIELTERKGTGNYDETRAEFNAEYVSMSERNLYQEVKKRLKDRNIDYQHRDRITMLNGITFTSGNEFFETLGMKFVESDKTYKTGDKKGQIRKTPDIKSKDDIQQAVSYYFDSCMDFLKDMVGEENIVMAQVHYDEDTPHLQAYFLPIVNSVLRKCYEKDKAGNVIKVETKNKNGDITIVPKLLRDDKGKIIYEEVKGKFLNNDSFWKSRGGKNSYAKMQDDFNKFITERGFKLDRGNVGANIENQSKLEWQVNELNAEIEELKQEKDYTTKEIENAKNILLKANENTDKEILNPKFNKVLGYNNKDVENLKDYSKNLEKINTLQTNEINSKDKQIDRLLTENNSFKNNDEIKKRNAKLIDQNNVIKEQKQEITRLNDLVGVLENSIETLKKKLEKWKNKFFEVIDKIFGKELSKYENDYLDYADDFIKDRKYKDKDKSDDFEIGM